MRDDAPPERHAFHTRDVEHPLKEFPIAVFAEDHTAKRSVFADGTADIGQDPPEAARRKSARDGTPDGFKQFVFNARKQIVWIGIMRVKGGAVYLRPLADLRHRDAGDGPLQHKRKQCLL